MKKASHIAVPVGAGAFVVYKNTADYWNEFFRVNGRPAFFIDTGAILCALNPNDTEVRPFLERQLIGNLVTSIYVIHETVQRIVKESSSNKFRGPDGKVKCE